MSKLVACIMAGGVGSRFWPASTADRPKQFLDILGLDRSLLQLTYDRYRELGLMPEDIFVITNAKYVNMVLEHLPDIPKNQIVGEPSRKNTAPAAYIGNALIQSIYGDAAVIMAPSDHHIEDQQAFYDVVHRGEHFLQEHDALITIGIEPAFPHTGYGYINFIDENKAPFKVRSFTEKPDLDTAKKFLETGEYLWNAGIFMWKTNTLNNAFESHSPEIKAIVDNHLIIRQGTIDTASLEQVFNQLPDASIDYEIMERADNVYTIPANMQWTDLGSWKSLFDKSSKTEQKNVDLTDNSIVSDARRNLIYAPGKKVIVKGLEDYMVIVENNTLVICPLDDDQEVKKWRNKFVQRDQELHR